MHCACPGPLQKWPKMFPANAMYKSRPRNADGALFIGTRSHRLFMPLPEHGTGPPSVLVYASLVEDPPPPLPNTHTHMGSRSVDEKTNIPLTIYIYIGTGFLLSKTVIVLLLLFAFRQQQDGIFLFIQDHLACQTGSDSCAVSSSQSLSVPFPLLTQTLQTQELRHKFWPSPTWRFFRCLSQFQLHS